MKPRFFKSADAFRAWLEEHHASVDELSVGFFKVKSDKAKAGRAGLTYREAVDEALCFGWIDGVLTPIDDQRYAHRFTPRRKNSQWSQKNLRRVDELRAEGRMHSAGERALAARPDDDARRYSFEQAAHALTPAFERALKKNRVAYQHFKAQTPSYQRLAVHWVMSAKKEETRARRLDVLLESSAAGEPVPPLRFGQGGRRKTLGSRP